MPITIAGIASTGNLPRAEEMKLNNASAKAVFDQVIARPASALSIAP